MTFPTRNAQKPAMITPEMIEAGARTLALINCNSVDEAEACWPNYKEDAESCLTAALVLHKPGVPGGIEKLIGDLVREPDFWGHGPDCVGRRAAAALRSLALEVERAKLSLSFARSDLCKGAVIEAAEQRIRELEADLAAAKAVGWTAPQCPRCGWRQSVYEENKTVHKPLTMPEGLPEGPWHVRRVLPDGNTFSVWSGSSCIVTGVTEKIAQAIASLPDLCAELAKAIAMADELWVAREQIRGELDAVRAKTIETLPKRVNQICRRISVFNTVASSYELRDDDPLLVETIDGDKKLGSGWFIVQECELTPTVPFSKVVKEPGSTRTLATGETKPADV